MPLLEVIATTLDEALEAQAGGADSLELCVDLAAEGLTMPVAQVQAIRVALPTMRLYAMVRPHARHFVYNRQDVLHIVHHAEQFAALGVDGLVFGAHTPAGDLHMPLLRLLARHTALPVTLHRALDGCNNPDATLERALPYAQRILSSGAAATAWAGRAQLAAWVQRYPEAQFVAAGGLAVDNVRALYMATGVQCCHVGRAAQTAGRVDRAKVAHLRAILDN